MPCPPVHKAPGPEVRTGVGTTEAVPLSVFRPVYAGPDGLSPN
jgi:hypothetical protein